MSLSSGMLCDLLIVVVLCGLPEILFSISCSNPPTVQSIYPPLILLYISLALGLMPTSFLYIVFRQRKCPKVYKNTPKITGTVHMNLWKMDLKLA
jgi:hypothetical protein